MITQFSKDCTLIEWNEQQQTFYINRVRNGVPGNQINVHGVLIVHECQNDKIAFLILEYMEKYVLKKSTKPLTKHQVTAHIKALTKFADAFCKKR